MIASMSCSAFTGYLYFNSSNSGNTITTAGRSISNTIVFDGDGGEWTLQDDFIAPNSSISLNNGTLTTNNQNLSCYYMTSNISSNNRVINLGSSIVTIGHSWDLGNGISNYTINAGTSTINFINDPNLGGYPILRAGDQTYYDVNILNTLSNQIIDNNGTFHNITFIGSGRVSGNNIANDVSFGRDGYIQDTDTFHDVNTVGDLTISSSNSKFHNVTIGGNLNKYNSSLCNFNCLNIAGNGTISGTNTIDTLQLSAGKTYSFEKGQTQTLISLIANGNCSSPITIGSTEIGTQAVFNSSSANITANNLRLRDINATGGAKFTANNSIDFGNNTGWDHIYQPSGINLYWVGGTGKWNDSINWSTTSGGPGGACIPNIYDDVYFDVHSFNIQSQEVNIDALAYCNNMNWQGATNGPFMTGHSSLHIYGSMTFIPSLNSNFSGELHFNSSSTGNTITSAGKPFSKNVYFDGVGGEWALQDVFTVNDGAIYLNNGSLNTNNKHLSCSSFNSSNSNVRSLNLGTSILTITNSWNFATTTNLTLNAIASTINLTGNSSSFFGGNQAYHNLNLQSENFSWPYPSVNGNNLFNDVDFAGYGAIYGNNISRNVSFMRDALFYADNHISKLTFLGDAQLNSSNTIDSLILTPGHTYSLSVYGTQTLKYLEAIGTSALHITIQSLYNYSGSQQANIYKADGSICADYLNIRDSKAIGGAFFFAGSHSIDYGNNSGWSFSGTFGNRTQKTNLTCSGVNSGTAKILAAGCSVPFTYLWSTNATIDSIGGLAAGIYTYTVTDAQLNQQTGFVIIEDAIPIIIDSINYSDNPCNISNIGTITINASGGSGPLSYSIDGGSTFLNTTGTFTGLSAGNYSISVKDSLGCILMGSSIVIHNGCFLTLILKVFIEGFYSGGGLMQNGTSGISQVGCLNTDFVALSGNPFDVDSVKLSLISEVYPYLVVDSTIAILKTNGFLIATFTNATAGSYFLKVNHRNSIETWSGSPLLMGTSTMYDFTDMASKAYGSNQQDLGDGNFALFSGDISDGGNGLGGLIGIQDGIVESSDYGDMENAVYFTYTGYVVADITGDGIVESSDYGLVENAVYFTRVVMRP